MTSNVTSARPSLNEHLVNAQVKDDLRHLIVNIAKAGTLIQHAIRTTEAGLSGQVNQFGEEQQKLDVMSDEIIQNALHHTKMVHSYISEEQSEVVELTAEAPYAVVFDPLDGSSLIDVNFAIGSIFGIYETNELLGSIPRDQVAALYVLYGPRTLLTYSTGKGVHSFILNEVGEFILLEENMGIADEAKNFSPGNLQALADNPGYKVALEGWLKEKTLRYSGCMVADIHHILAKGQGVFTNLGGKKYPEGKLRLAFECGPFAYLVEHAGGASSDGTQSILDKKITNIDQRTPIIIGSTNEVQKVVKLLNA